MTCVVTVGFIEYECDWMHLEVVISPLKSAIQKLVPCLHKLVLFC